MSKRHSFFAVAVLMFVSLILFSCSKSDKYPLEGTTWFASYKYTAKYYGDQVLEDTYTIKFQKSTFNFIMVLNSNSSDLKEDVVSGTYHYEEPKLTLISEDFDEPLIGKIVGDVLTFDAGEDQLVLVKQ